MNVENQIKKLNAKVKSLENDKDVLFKAFDLLQDTVKRRMQQDTVKADFVIKGSDIELVVNRALKNTERNG